MSYEAKEHIKEQLKSVPQSPGVYIMYDASDDIIYVGKSKSLKNRLSSYFRGFDSHLPKVQTMVVNIHRFEYILTDSEVEALILEANLIKKHLPRFNILLKDDKSYPYIVVTLGENFPRVFLTRSFHKGPHKYFGPYTSTEDTRTAVEVIQTLYPLRECSRIITDKVQRPCLNYHIGRCAGVCNHMISKEEYNVYIQKVIRFLNGDREWLIKELEDAMRKTANEMNFEKAMVYRDQIKALNSLYEKQKALQVNQLNQDYIAYYMNEWKICVMLFQVRDGKIEGRESFLMSNRDRAIDESVLTSFISQYYSGATQIPKEIYVCEAFEDMSLYSNWLSKLAGSKVSIVSPERGEKKKTILLVQKNAIEYLTKFEKSIEKEAQIREAAEIELREMLDFHNKTPLKRIEAYDISNTMGVYSVGSMVVYEDFLKKKSDYRRYRIKTIEGPNDYGSMQEILYRRFKRALEEQEMTQDIGLDVKEYRALPDLVLIDGGVGHVNAAIDVLNALKISVPVAGMVKDEFHKTSDLYYDEKLRGLKNYRSAFKIVSEIQDEVHRFAIEYHKSLRSKEMVHSILDDIQGIGEKRRVILLKHFGSVEKISEASLVDLSGVPGINKSVAETIYKFFHKQN